MKIIKIYSLLILGIVIFFATGAFYSQKDYVKNYKVFEKTDAECNKEIIKFNHGLHIKDAGMKCADCHDAALKSEKASDNLNPNHQNCSACHDVADKKECSKCHYENVYKKLTQSSKELIFSHKQHITVLKKECTDCHKGLENVKYASEAATPAEFMTGCYSCHDNTVASSSCNLCHSNQSALTPVNHLASDFKRNHKSVIDFSTGKNECSMCHNDNFCQVCHASGNYYGMNTVTDFYVPFDTKESGINSNNSKAQKLSTVHELNYTYLHGLDANHKNAECKNCHDPIVFCSACHANSGNLQTGYAPQSHLEPNFTTLGVNTGGGLHAKLARTDIENCEGCHSVSGADPVCIKCHFDNDGVRGTNPKTHENGYMSDERGIWHDTEGAICYSCHTDPYAKPNGMKGVGFCSYCHGK